MTEQIIYVTIFEDNKDLREGMQQILNASPGFGCAAAYANCNNLIKRLQESKPDVVLMDIRLQGDMDGIEAAALLRRSTPGCRVIMLTTFDDEEYVVRSLRADTSGYRSMYRALARSAGMQKSAANSSRASTTTASTAPQASARWRIASRSSPPWPTSSATAMTSAPVCSARYGMATDVSRPPE